MTLNTFVHCLLYSRTIWPMMFPPCHPSPLTKYCFIILIICWYILHKGGVENQIRVSCMFYIGFQPKTLFFFENSTFLNKVDNNLNWNLLDFCMRLTLKFKWLKYINLIDNINIFFSIGNVVSGENRFFNPIIYHLR